MRIRLRHPGPPKSDNRPRGGAAAPRRSEPVHSPERRAEDAAARHSARRTTRESVRPGGGVQSREWARSVRRARGARRCGADAASRASSCGRLRPSGPTSASVAGYGRSRRHVGDRSEAALPASIALSMAMRSALGSTRTDSVPSTTGRLRNSCSTELPACGGDGDRCATRARAPAGDHPSVRQGEGPVLLFVHGLLVSHTLWELVIERARRLGTACVAIDLPLGAHRRADATRTPTSPPRGVARDDRRASWSSSTCATSCWSDNDTGGAICQLVVAHHPERLAGLVLTTCDAYEHFPPPLLKGADLPRAQAPFRRCAPSDGPHSR